MMQNDAKFVSCIMRGIVALFTKILKAGTGHEEPEKTDIDKALHEIMNGKKNDVYENKSVREAVEQALGAQF